MDSQGHCNTANSVDWWVSRIVRVCKQCVSMGFAWSGLGVLIGVNTARIQHCDTLGLVSQIIAWAIIMGMMGSVLGLLGSKVRLVFLAAACGLLLGLYGDWTMGYSWPHAHANNGLLMGAIVGTTVGPWLKMYVQAAKGIRAAIKWMAGRPGP